MPQVRRATARDGEGRQGGGAVRAATQALEARLEDQVANRMGRDSRRVEEGSMEVDRASAPRDVAELLADGALDIVQAAVAVPAVSNARARGRGGDGTRSRSPAR